MKNNERLLLDLMQKHQVERSISYKNGEFFVNTDTSSFDEAFKELKEQEYINREGMLTAKGKRHLHLPSPAKMNPSLVQGIATKCIEELAYLVAEKGWNLNDKFSKAVRDLVYAGEKRAHAEELLNRVEPEVIDYPTTVVDMVSPPEIEHFLQVEQEEEHQLNPVANKPKKSKKKN